MSEMRILSNSISAVTVTLHDIYSADLLVQASSPLLEPAQESATVWRELQEDPANVRNLDTVQFASLTDCPPCS